MAPRSDGTVRERSLTGPATPASAGGVGRPRGAARGDRPPTRGGVASRAAGAHDRAATLPAGVPKLWSSGPIATPSLDCLVYGACSARGRRAIVGGGVVEQSDDGTAEVPQEFLEKKADFFLSDIVEKEQIVETQALSSGADRNSGDDRNFVPSPLTMSHPRSRTLGCPSSDDQGSQQEARFVGKN